MKETWHGKASGYVYHKCRCGACKKWQQIRDKEYRKTNYKKIRAHYQANRGKIAGQVKAYYQANREKIRAYNQTNPEKRLEYQKAYYQSNRERVLERRKAYYQVNREKELARARVYRETTEKRRRLYYEKNRNKIMAQQKAWRYTNRERIRAHESSRRAAIRGNGGTHTAEQWLALLSFYDHKCVKCGSANRIEKDHVVPISIGGTNDPINLQPLCHMCNARKHATAVDYRKSVPDWVFGANDTPI